MSELDNLAYLAQRAADLGDRDLRKLQVVLRQMDALIKSAQVRVAIDLKKQGKKNGG